MCIKEVSPYRCGSLVVRKQLSKSAKKKVRDKIRKESQERKKPATKGDLQRLYFKLAEMQRNFRLLDSKESRLNAYVPNHTT